ncbi:MAG TPA: glycosyltransferase family 39 protein [Acidobacteriaceae bacterium]|nr:glycosyltransferase family 39 protein [Acidobacteriaceae bacterium]
MSNHFALSADRPLETPAEAAAPLSPLRAWTLLLLVFLSVHFAALFSPSLLDDADTTHAIAAKHIAVSGDWVTLQVDGVRYLEKPPLPYWLVALDYRIFGYNVFATHLPLSLGVLGLAILAWRWAWRAYGDRAAFYAALSILTSIGVFLFTRVFIPEVLITLLLALALYTFLTGLEDKEPWRIYVAWAALALSMLSKGLIGPVFFVAAVGPYLALTGQWRRWRELRLGSGIVLFLAIAAPWHILAGLRNPDHGNPSGNIPTPGHVHGFFYFYFINEHFLRFLGKRYPDDYNKLPFLLYWTLHLVWLFPWSLYLPVVAKRLWLSRDQWWNNLRSSMRQSGPYQSFFAPSHTNRGPQLAFSSAWPSSRSSLALKARAESFRRHTTLLLSIFAVFVLLFFSISTNQEYYTFPAYFPLLMLTAGALASAEDEGASRRLLVGIQAALGLFGAIIAAALGYGLWVSRNYPYTADIGTLLAHRNVANYTLSMAHFFDLTGASFAALRMPAAIAAIGLLAGPAIAYWLRRSGRDFEATASVAFTAAIFLVAAHIALVRFEPMLSSRAMADTINRLAGYGGQPEADRKATLMLYGDSSEGSSLVFYTNRRALLVNGRISMMIWGSDYPDVPHIFLSDADLLSMWGTGPRKFLFVPEDSLAHVSSLLGSRGYVLQRLADKTLYTDRR